jgi:probable rRNA maturation factor
LKITLFNDTKEYILSNLTEEIANAIDNTTKIIKFNLKKGSKINLIIKSKKDITLLNKHLFKINVPTDVISINNPTKNTQNLGDVYICPSIIKVNAKLYNDKYNNELKRIIIHGILHLLGFDHKKPFRESKEKMFNIQEKLIKYVK